MKKFLIQAASIILLLFAGYQIGHLVSKKQFNKELDDIVNIYAEETTEDDYIDGLVLTRNNADISDAEGKRVDISRLAAANNVCARFSASGCRPCIETLTNALQDFTITHPDWHVNLLIDNIPLRDLYVLSKEFGKSFSLYSADNISADLGSQTSPVVFRITPDGTVYRHFKCDPEHPDRTINYVASIDL